MASRKMLIAASLQLFDILTKLLFASDNVERDIPTLTKLALVQNRDMLAGDVILFRQDLNDIQKEMGISSEKIEELTAEQNAEFEDKVKKALARVVEHSFTQVEKEELEYIKDIQFTAEDLSLILATLIKPKKETTEDTPYHKNSVVRNPKERSTRKDKRDTLHRGGVYHF